MADNTILSPGLLGDTIRDIDKSGVKTQVVTLDVGGAGAETLVAGTVPVSGTVSVSGGATSAKQDTGNTSLASIDGKITAVNTGAVVVSSSALPSGAATGAKQDTGNASLASIDGKLTNPLPISGTVAISTALNLEATQLLVKAKTDNLDVALSTRLKAADTLAAVTTVGTITNPVGVSNAFNLEATQLLVKAKTDNLDVALSTRALESGGNLATLVARQPALGTAVISASSPVNIASDQTVAVSAASLPLPSGAASSAIQTTMQASLTTLTNLVDQNNQIIKLLSAILVTLGNNGNGFVQPEEATELSTLQ